MSTRDQAIINVGQIERLTQNRIVKLFQDELDYKYIGNLEDRDDNSNIEEEFLKLYLTSRGYTDTQVTKALYQLTTTANNYNESLYANNKNVYKLLRYGVQIKAEVGDNFETVHLIDWNNPENNDFLIAEEVTVHSNHDKRPDIVLYVNGIAIAVLELKRSTISVGHGIRQNIVNQKIAEDLPVHKIILPKDEALKIGAHHFFGDKYGDEVSVYYIGDSLENAYSKEFCGGPHVERTGVLGHFTITKEESVAQGVRRIKAILE